MSIYSITVNCIYHDSKHTIKEEDIDKKKNYSYASCWESIRFSKETNVYRFWKSFIQLVNTITKKTLTSKDENLAKRLSLKLIESIYYHYLLKKPVAETVRLIQIIITEI